MEVGFGPLGEAVCQPSEAAHLHPVGKVLPLHIGRGDVFRIGAPFQAGLLDPGLFGRAIAARRMDAAPPQSSGSSPVAIRMTFTAPPITSAGRLSPWGPLGTLDSQFAYR